MATAAGLMKLMKKVQVHQVQKKVERKTNAQSPGAEPTIDKSQ